MRNTHLALAVLLAPRGGDCPDLSMEGCERQGPLLGSTATRNGKTGTDLHTARLAPAAAAADGIGRPPGGGFPGRSRRPPSSSGRSSRRKREPSRKRRMPRRASANATASWPRATCRNLQVGGRQVRFDPKTGDRAYLSDAELAADGEGRAAGSRRMVQSADRSALIRGGIGGAQRASAAPALPPFVPAPAGAAPLSRRRREVDRSPPDPGRAAACRAAPVGRIPRRSRVARSISGWLREDA